MIDGENRPLVACCHQQDSAVLQLHPNGGPELDSRSASRDRVATDNRGGCLHFTQCPTRLISTIQAVPVVVNSRAFFAACYSGEEGAGSYSPLPDSKQQASVVHITAFNLHHLHKVSTLHVSHENGSKIEWLVFLG